MTDIDYELARLSELVYDPWPGLEGALLRTGWRLLSAPFDHAGTQAMLVQRSDNAAAALVFRGTQATGKSWRERVIDFTANLRFWPVLWAGSGRVHAGYAAALSRVRYPAREMADDVPSSVPLYVTGHSLGGALATLYAAWADHKIAGLVTFGAPKAGTENALSSIVAYDVRRYVMPADFAPSWPPVPGLTHPGDELRLDAPGWWPGPVSRHAVGGYVEAAAPDPSWRRSASDVN